jgi:hypothetical protein
MAAFKCDLERLWDGLFPCQGDYQMSQVLIIFSLGINWNKPICFNGVLSEEVGELRNERRYRNGMRTVKEGTEV